MTEGLTAIAAVVLAILGIVGVVPVYMASIASILIGGALLAEASAVAGEYASLTRFGGSAMGNLELGAGTSTPEFIVGGAAIVLGILSLVGVHALVLLPASVIAIGAALVLNSGSASRFNDVRLGATGANAVARDAARAAGFGSAGAQMLAGFAAIVLGILALVMDHALILSLVGFLVASAALVIGATAMGGKALNYQQTRGPQTP